MSTKLTPERRRPAPILAADRDDCIFSMLHAMARRANTLFEEHLAGTGLTAAQYIALGALDRRGSCSPVELAQDLQLDPTAASSAVGMLVEEGMIEVSPDQQAGCNDYRLTPSGRARLKAAFPAWERAQAEIKKVMTSGQLSNLSEAAVAIIGRAHEAGAKERSGPIGVALDEDEAQSET